MCVTERQEVMQTRVGTKREMGKGKAATGGEGGERDERIKKRKKQEEIQHWLRARNEREKKTKQNQIIYPTGVIYGGRGRSFNLLCRSGKLVGSLPSRHCNAMRVLNLA